MSPDAEFDPWKQPEPYIRHYEVKDGVLTVHRRTRRERDFKIRNVGGGATSVVIQVTGTDRWTTDPGATQPVERVGNLDRFEVPTKPTSETTFRFVETHSSPAHARLTDLSEKDIRELMAQTGNNPGFTALLQPFLDARKQLADFKRRLQRNDEATQLAQTEEDRIRANMTALSGHSGDASLSHLYSDEMKQQENKLTSLREEKEDILRQQHAVEDGVITKAGALPHPTPSFGPDACRNACILRLRKV